MYIPPEAAVWECFLGPWTGAVTRSNPLQPSRFHDIYNIISRPFKSYSISVPNCFLVVEYLILFWYIALLLVVSLVIALWLLRLTQKQFVSGYVWISRLIHPNWITCFSFNTCGEFFSTGALSAWNRINICTKMCLRKDESFSCEYAS